MEIKEECLAYLGQYYKELFFGTANKRYRSMTGADLKHRLNRLSQETLNGVEKPNELNDIHAMFAKVCAYLMHKEERLKPGPALDQLKENWKKWKISAGCWQAKEYGIPAGADRRRAGACIKNAGHPPLPSYQLLRAGLSAVLSSKDY